MDGVTLNWSTYPVGGKKKKIGAFAPIVHSMRVTADITLENTNYFWLFIFM